MPKPLRPDGKMQVYTFSQGNRLYAAVQKAGIDTKTGKFSPRRTLYGKVKDNVFTGNPVVGKQPGFSKLLYDTIFVYFFFHSEKFMMFAF